MKISKYLEWWNELKYEIRNKLSYKYFQKEEPISLDEIKSIYFAEKDNNIDYWIDNKTI